MSLCFSAVGLWVWGDPQPLVRQTLPRRVWGVGMGLRGRSCVGTHAFVKRNAR